MRIKASSQSMMVPCRPFHTERPLQEMQRPSLELQRLDSYCSFGFPHSSNIAFYCRLAQCSCFQSTQHRQDRRILPLV
eukprot:16416_5